MRSAYAGQATAFNAASPRNCTPPRANSVPAIASARKSGSRPRPQVLPRPPRGVASFQTLNRAARWERPPWSTPESPRILASFVSRFLQTGGPNGWTTPPLRYVGCSASRPLRRRALNTSGIDAAPFNRLSTQSVGRRMMERARRGGNQTCYLRTAGFFGCPRRESGFSTGRRHEAGCGFCPARLRRSLIFFIFLHPDMSSV